MKYNNDELKKMVRHGIEEVANFRRYLVSYKDDNKDILTKRYKEANMALNILIEYKNFNECDECDELDSCVGMLFRFSNRNFDDLSKEGVFYYLDKIRNLEPFFNDSSDDKDDEPKKHIIVTFII